MARRTPEELEAAIERRINEILAPLPPLSEEAEHAIAAIFATVPLSRLQTNAA